MNKSTWLVCAALLVSQAWAGPEDIARQWCANCHGADGNSTSPLFPRLAGQQAGYLELQLQQFRQRGRSNPAAHDYMWGVAGTLDDAAISGLAAYFAAQKPSPNPVNKADPTLLAQGRKLFEEGKPDGSAPACASCHGAHGEGSEVGPRIAGQHAPYLARQLRVFETPQRASAVAMQAIVQALSDDDIKALAIYIQGL